MPHRVNFTSMFKLAVFNIQHLNSNREDFFAFIFFFALNCRKDWSKFNALTSANPISSSGMYQNYIIVCIEVSSGPQKHPPYFLPSPLQIVQASLFRPLPIYIVFCDPLSPKNWWTPMILTFLIFNSNLSFKSK